MDIQLGGSDDGAGLAEGLLDRGGHNTVQISLNLQVSVGAAGPGNGGGASHGALLGGEAEEATQGVLVLQFVGSAGVVFGIQCFFMN